MSHLTEAALGQLFEDARTHSYWTDGTLDDATIERLYELTKMGPTSANCSPARFVFVRSAEAKAKLKTALPPGNVDKTMNAAATVIVAHDMEFYEKLPELYPHTDARSWFAGKPDAIAETAFRNGTLQGAYLILAARALGIDCGPMSGFDQARVDELFFAGTSWKSNFLINLGHGDVTKLHPRSPRLPFGEACRIE